VNAVGTTWNLLMVKPYIDGGPAVCNATVAGQCSPNAPDAGVAETWDMTPGVKVGVQVNGTLNDPVEGSHDWTVELCLPLAEYARYEGEGVNVPPKDGDYWRINFSRVQHKVHVETRADGSKAYVKDEDVPPDNWVFSPMGVINMCVLVGQWGQGVRGIAWGSSHQRPRPHSHVHYATQPTHYHSPHPPNTTKPSRHLPERWGYAYFTEKGVNRTAAPRWRDGETEQGPRDPLWPVKEALAQVYEAEKTYDALYGAHPWAGLCCVGLG
jgi:hypothetical protein